MNETNTVFVPNQKMKKKMVDQEEEEEEVVSTNTPTMFDNNHNHNHNLQKSTTSIYGDNKYEPHHRPDPISSTKKRHEQE